MRYKWKLLFAKRFGNKPFKKCALCGHFKHYKSIIHQASTITAANGKIFALKQTLDCLSYDINVAMCRLCHKQYIGQTISKFSKRRCQHRFIWNQFKYDNIDPKAALLHRYHTFHRLNYRQNQILAIVLS